MFAKCSFASVLKVLDFDRNKKKTIIKTVIAGCCASNTGSSDHKKKTKVFSRKKLRPVFYVL